MSSKILLYVDRSMSMTENVSESLFTIEDDIIYYTDPLQASGRSKSTFEMKWFRENLFPDKKFDAVYNRWNILKRLNKLKNFKYG